MRRYLNFLKLISLLTIVSFTLSGTTSSPNTEKQGDYYKVRIQQNNNSGGLDVGKAD